MRATALLLDKHFGNLAKYKNIVEITLSPHELNPYKGLITKGLPNILRRLRGQIFFVAPPFLVSYAIMEWADEENIRRYRKDPKKYENDK